MLTTPQPTALASCRSRIGPATNTMHCSRFTALSAISAITASSESVTTEVRTRTTSASSRRPADTNLSSEDTRRRGITSPVNGSSASTHTATSAVRTSGIAGATTETASPILSIPVTTCLFVHPQVPVQQTRAMSMNYQHECSSRCDPP
jgi:hypothetical protein